MKENEIGGQEKKSKMSFFDYLMEMIGWLEIVASPLLAALVMGACIYFSHPTTWRLFLAAAIVVTSLTIGILLANNIWKKHGTMRFMSSLMATPELDEPTESITAKPNNDNTENKKATKASSLLPPFK